MAKKPKPSENKAKDVETPRLNHQGALQFLDIAVSMSPLTRQQHVQAQQAVQQLDAALVELEQLKKPKPKE
jgi:hypothetical protein